MGWRRHVRSPPLVPRPNLRPGVQTSAQLGEFGECVDRQGRGAEDAVGVAVVDNGSIGADGEWRRYPKPSTTGEIHRGGRPVASRNGVPDSTTACTAAAGAGTDQLVVIDEGAVDIGPQPRLGGQG